MSEEEEAPPEKPEEKKPEKPEEKKEAPKPLSRPTELIIKANEAAERIEKANDDLKATLDRQERLQVERTLGGSAEAGQRPTTEEEKADEAARKQLEGTGFEEQLFPKKTEEKK